MRDAAFLLVVASCTFTGFVLLALSQKRHWSRAGGGEAPSVIRRAVFRSVASFLLAAALVLAIEREGGSFGSLLWVLTLSIAGFAVVVILAWCPRWFVLLTRGTRRKKAVP